MGHLVFTHRHRSEILKVDSGRETTGEQPGRLSGISHVDASRRPSWAFWTILSRSQRLAGISLARWRGYRRVFGADAVQKGPRRSVKKWLVQRL